MLQLRFTFDEILVSGGTFTLSLKYRCTPNLIGDGMRFIEWTDRYLCLSTELNDEKYT